MDYLRNLGTALVQKTGITLPYTLQGKVTELNQVWTLYDAVKRDDSSLVSVFEYDFGGSRRASMPLAKNALRKLRTVRHPDVLKFIDVVETDTSIMIMTERVRPLPSLDTAKEDWLLWGLHRISIALAFVNDSCASTHAVIRPSSIFISPSGEWKLGGFELLSNPKDDAAVLYTQGSSMPGLSQPPEVLKSGWHASKEQNPAAADAYAFGLLLHSVFNPKMGPPPTASPPHPPPQASSRGAIPTSIFPSYKKLLNPNPKARMTVKLFLELGMSESGGPDAGFFVNNSLVQVCSKLENFALSSEVEKTSFLRNLKESVASFPTEFASFKVLPSLVTALEHGGASAAAILPLVLQIGKNVSDSDYPTQILAPLIKLFASPDRGTRMALLEHLPEYVDKLDKKAVADKVWPHLQTGFADTVAVIREATVRSIILLEPKLNERILNNELLRHLAKMQTDVEASIRTNTCILIGRLGPTLGYHTKRKVLVPAFTRAIKDPFVHARVAGLMAFMACVDCFETEELATKVVPNVAGAMIDREKLVRNQGFKAIELFVGRLSLAAAAMPEIVEEEISIPGISAQYADPVGQATLVNSAAGAAGALAGWAISSLGKKLTSSEVQSSMEVPGAFPSERPTSAPPINVETRPALPYTQSTMSAANSTVSSPALLRANPLVSKAKGLQLGASKVPLTSLSAALAEEIAAAEEIVDGNPWGSDDLMDVNADEDDWSAFENAPAHQSLPTIVTPQPVKGLGLGIGLGAQNGHATTVYDAPSFPTLSTQPRKSSATSKAPTPVASPPLDDDWDAPAARTKSPAMNSPAPSMVGLSKEDKAAEMVRRKEERKQRIAQLKEQKKTGKA